MKTHQRLLGRVVVRVCFEEGALGREDSDSKMVLDESPVPETVLARRTVGTPADRCAVKGAVEMCVFFFLIFRKNKAFAFGNNRGNCFFVACGIDLGGS